MRRPAPRREERAHDGRPRRAVPPLPVVLELLRPQLIAVVLLLGYYLLPWDREFTGGTVVLLVAGLAAVLVLFLWQLRAVARSPRPVLRAAETLVSVLMLFLLLFATAYHLLERAEPHSFTEHLTRTDALYFTLTTFTTVGFGDITARSQTARVMTMIQMTGGLLFAGVAVRIVVDTVKAARRRQDPSGGAEPGGPPGDRTRR